MAALSSTKLTSGVASMASPAAGSSTASSVLVTRALPVFHQIQGMRARTHESIISCREFYHPDRASLPALLDKYGERYFQYMDLTVDINSARKAYRLAYVELGLPRCIYAIGSALVLEEGVGSCGEFSAMTEILAKTAGLAAKTIVLEGEVCDGAGAGAGGVIRDDHALVLVAEDPKVISDEAILSFARPCLGDFVKTMKSMRNVVIIDPYLNKMVVAEDIEKDEEFVGLLKALKVSKFSKSIEPDLTLDTIAKERGLVVDKIRAIRPFAELVPASGELVRIKRRDLIVDKLQAVFPGTSGRWKKHNKCIWLVGSESSNSEIAARLSAIGIPVNNHKVKGKEEFCLYIDIEPYSAARLVYEKMKELD